MPIFIDTASLIVEISLAEGALSRELSNAVFRTQFVFVQEREQK